MKSKWSLILLIIIIIIVIFYLLIYFNIIPIKKYSNSYFNIPRYVSKNDQDQDQIDDQTDILNNAKNYIAKKPIYESKYYATGYPDDNYGVCTDVVAFALKNAGYDLRELVNNLKVYFKNTALALSLDPKDIEAWQGGDIVIFNNHIGIVSDNRNKKGIALVIHHYSKHQKYYEEDILTKKEIVGHYRIS